MKVSAARVEAFLARPEPEMVLALLYGPDAGQVAERARRLAGAIVDDLHDPFRVSELKADELRNDPARLTEEAQALCLMGGRRLVRVREASDGIAQAVRDLLALPLVEGFVLLEAGELGASSSLRRAVEAAPKAVALPCFLPSEQELADQLRTLLGERRLEAAPEAFDWLLANLGGDRTLTRSEIDKLDLYVGDAPQRKVTLADVVAVIGDSSALSLDDMVHAAVLGRQAELDAALDRLLAEGEAPVRLLRVTSTFLLRLLRLRAEIAAGVGVEAAIKAARPPIHFSAVPVVRATLQRWSGDALIGGLALLQVAESRCKSTAAPEALIVRAALMQLAGLTRRPERREHAAAYRA